MCNGKPIKKAMRLVAEVGLDKEGFGTYYWNDGLYENEATDDGVFFRISGWAPRHQGRGGEHGDIQPELHVYHRCGNREFIGYAAPYNVTVGNRTYTIDPVPEISSCISHRDQL